jgi:hypothetical protein
VKIPADLAPHLPRLLWLYYMGLIPLLAVRPLTVRRIRTDGSREVRRDRHGDPLARFA